MWGDITLWFWCIFPWRLVLCWASFYILCTIQILNASCYSSCLLTILNLFGKCVFKCFCPFLIGLFAFLLLGCKNFLYRLDINPLSYKLFSNIFSQAPTCLVSLNTDFYRPVLFCFVFIWWSPVYFLIYGLWFWWNIWELFA